MLLNLIGLLFFKIGQIILDYHKLTHQKCRIIFSEPNELIAYSAACQVAKERGEALGQTVGYQLSLDNK